MGEHSKVCEAVIERARGSCEICGRAGAHIHHIIPKSDPGPWTWLEQNLALVCEFHDNPMLHTPAGKTYLINKFASLYRGRGYDYTRDPWRQYMRSL